jgi:hypothetical protein
MHTASSQSGAATCAWAIVLLCWGVLGTAPAGPLTAVRTRGQLHHTSLKSLVTGGAVGECDRLAPDCPPAPGCPFPPSLPPPPTPSLQVPIGLIRNAMITSGAKQFLVDGFPR